MIELLEEEHKEAYAQGWNEGQIALKEMVNKEREEAVAEEREKWIGNDVYSFLGNELHLYCRACIEKVKITRNGEVFEFSLPQALTPDQPLNNERE